jgi:choline/glycine/proline betaine transport protein
MMDFGWVGPRVLIKPVARWGTLRGLLPGVGLAAEGMIFAFVFFTALNVDLANGIYSDIKGWIESALN